MIKKPYKAINKILILLVIISLAYLVWDTLNTKPYSLNLKPIPAGIANSTEKKEGLKPLSFYTQPSSQRNIFLPEDVKIVDEVKKEPEVPKVPITQLAKDLKVVGFSLGDPIMVMIENSQTGKTQFLVEGDIINETLTIKSVSNTSVVLTNGKEEITLE